MDDRIEQGIVCSYPDLLYQIDQHFETFYVEQWHS